MTEARWAGSRKTRAAVLRESGLPRPYAETHPLTIETLELDAPHQNEVLIALEAASVCHSDLSVVNGSRLRPLPMVLGHEAAGRIVEVGAGVDDLPVGQRVITTFLPRCEECAACARGGLLPCERGSRSNAAGELLMGGSRIHGPMGRASHHLGISGFAEYAVVDRRSVVAVADDIPPEVAALMGCAVLTGGGALLNNARIEKGDSVAVVGLGGVGMAAILTAVAVGCAEIVAVDNQPEKLALASRLGATRCLTSSEAIEQNVRVRAVLEAVGHPSALQTAVCLVEPGGIAVTVGLPGPGQEVRLDPLRITSEALTIVGSYMGASVPSRDIPRFIDWWREGRFPVEDLISDRITIDELNEAMDKLADASALRQIVRFSRD